MANSRRRCGLWAVALLAVGAIWGVALPSVAQAADPAPLPRVPTEAAPETPAPPGEDSAAAAQMLALVNSDRAANGLNPVTPVDTIGAQAVQHSFDMSAQQTLFHDDAYFSTENHKKLGAKKLGQNVALNRTVTDAETRLMADPGHHDIILDPAWTIIGIGVVRDDTGHIWVTQDFAQTSSAASAPVTPPADPVVTPPANNPSPSPAPAPASAPAPGPAPASAPRAAAVAPVDAAAAVAASASPSGTDANAQPADAGDDATPAAAGASIVIPFASSDTLPIVKATTHESRSSLPDPPPYVIWAIAASLLLAVFVRLGHVLAA